MNTITKAVIVVIIIIILGAVIYIAFAPTMSNCDPTAVYTKEADNITGTSTDGTIQCYCPTDTTDSNGVPLAAWVAQNNTQYYFCVYATSP